jgi:hypothetical protein
MNEDRTLLVISMALTGSIATIALHFMPDHDGLLPALRILPAWMVVTALLAGVFGLAHMWSRREDRPLRAMTGYMRANPAKVLAVVALMAVAGLNLIAFMWLKPLLNYLVPFTADPLLADFDHALFLGHDPWTLFGWLKSPWTGTIYHPFWFVLMIIALYASVAAPESPERSAVVLSYFVLWTVVGPLIHVLLPAAGPIFYERMGYGSRFADLTPGAETTAVADYLWSIYASKSFGAGSGISAMPSMHVTMSTWTAIGIANLLPRWRIAGFAGWVVIFLLSIALGGHYAADGIVGVVAALLCYYTILHLLRPMPQKGSDIQVTQPPLSLAE